MPTRSTRRIAGFLALLCLGLRAPPVVGLPVAAQAPPLGREQANVWMPLDLLTPPSPALRRANLLDHIRREIAARGSTLPAGEVDRILAAMATLDREAFLPPAERRRAYLPASLDIGEGQTLSDAYLVTVMLAAARIEPGARVLDVGTGSGYQAALLDRLGARVTTIEILPGLARQAAARLRRMGLARIRVVVGDGGHGVATDAPYDAIVVAAGSTTIPAALVAQLAPGGRLVMPIGPTQLAEQLLLIRKLPDGLDICTMGAAAAVPLTGMGGQDGIPLPPGPRRACFGAPVT